MVFLRGIALLIGVAIVLATLFSAVKTFVLPRAAPDPISSLVFRMIRRLIQFLTKRVRSYYQRDRVMAYFAPISLLALLPVWYSLITVGYTLVYWAMGGVSIYQAFRVSGSSLLTLGYATIESPLNTVLEFTQATIGLMLVALLIAYLPSMYAAFSKREAAVTLLEVRAGNPPSAVEMLLRYNRIHGLDRLTDFWAEWEMWFAEVQESHTSLAALVFFRSPDPDHSWVSASGTVLDAASLLLAAVDRKPDPQAALCIRAGYLAMRSIADFFRIPYNPNPHYPSEPISVTRAQFEEACLRLAQGGIPLKEDMDAAWSDFAGWRVNYDAVLVPLARLTLTPPTPWISETGTEN